MSDATKLAESLEIEAIILEQASALANEYLDAAEAIKDRFPFAAQVLARAAEQARQIIAQRSMRAYSEAGKLTTKQRERFRWAPDITPMTPPKVKWAMTEQLAELTRKDR